MSEGLPRGVFVGVGVGGYGKDSGLDVLEKAISDVEGIAALLGDPDRFGVEVRGPSLDVDRGELVNALKVSLEEGGLALPETALVVYWAGHGDQNEVTGSLRLYLASNSLGDPDDEVYTAEQLAERIGRSGAKHVLLLLDTCRSGGAVVDVAKVIANIRRKLPDVSDRWFGVLASCQPFEKAVDGAFARILMKLLEEGPDDPALRVRWNSYAAGLRGDDLIEAIVKEWEQGGQTPEPMTIGVVWKPMLRNPLHRVGLPDQVVEDHLLWAARGGAATEAGFWFVGREKELEEVVAWIRRREPGLFVATGPPGSGKTAIVGRIVSLSIPLEREAIEEATGLPAAELDPGEGVVAAHIHARGLNLEDFAKRLGYRLGISTDDELGHHGVLAWAAEQKAPPLVVVDGLDEAGLEAATIVEDLLAPLAQYARVLVASREVDRGDQVPSLLELLAPADGFLDLGEDPAATLRDIHRYIQHRLVDVDTDIDMDPVGVADAVVELVRSPEQDTGGPFLLARILTSQLREHPLDTTQAGWGGQLPTSVADAFTSDLEHGEPRLRDGVELPQAGRELVTALAYAYGSGFPADDIWPVVATALSPTNSTYTRDDAYWALLEYGRYVIASSEGGDAVYRLAHQQLIDVSRDSEGEGLWRRVREDTAATITTALVNEYQTFLNEGREPGDHPYLWNYTWRHASDAGPPGIQSLQQLAETIPAFLPDVASALNNLGNRYSEIGKRQEAVAPTEEAVDLYRDLAAANPAYFPGLAGTLNNLGNRYNEVGRLLEAVAPTEEARDRYRDLTETNPAYLPDLANALNNLGIRYSDIGRRLEGVAPTEEARDLYRDLAATNPAYLHDLANALNNLGLRYSEVGRGLEWVAPAEEAVDLYRDLIATHPAYLPDLAMALSNLAGAYRVVGRSEEMLPPIEEARDLYRDLAATNPAYLPALAKALNNLGITYSEVGRPQEEVAPTEEARDLYRDLAETNPAYLPDLAGALNNLGSSYSEVGRAQEGFAPTEEARDLYRDLAEANPAYLPDLARALNNLGSSYSEIGKRQEAVAPTEEAVRLRRDLAATNPAFLPDLAMALNTLGNRYSEVGREDEIDAAWNDVTASLPESLSEALLDLRR